MRSLCRDGEDFNQEMHSRLRRTSSPAHGHEETPNRNSHPCKGEDFNAKSTDLKTPTFQEPPVPRGPLNPKASISNTWRALRP